MKDTVSTPQTKEPLRSVADLRLGEGGCLAACRDKALAQLLSERGMPMGTPVRLCWRAALGGTLCVEVCSARFTLRESEAASLLLSHG